MTEEELKKLSAEQLYKLAQKKEAQEAKRAEMENKSKIAALRKERAEMLKRHKQEINAINKQIKALGGRVPVSSAASKAATSATAAIVEILEAGELDTQTIREKLNELGISVKNLGQTLSYLKRNGQVASVARGIYRKA
jgi:chromosome segregation ATPase